MLHSLLSRTVGLFRDESSDEDDSNAGDGERLGGSARVRDAGSRERRSRRAAADGGGTATSLYRCPACDRTYVSDSMATCSRCDGEVERVPNETELGLVGD